MTVEAKKPASKKAGSTKGKKLRPRDPEKVCGAKTDHGPCQQWKGFGTDHVGIGSCSRHLGATKNHNAAADLWVPRTVSRLLTSAFVVAQAPRLPAIADQHDRSLWPSDSPTSCSDAC